MHIFHIEFCTDFEMPPASWGYPHYKCSNFVHIQVTPLVRRSGRVWLVTFRLGTGKSLIFLTVYTAAGLGYLAVD
jgi:hypothetical protein